MHACAYAGRHAGVWQPVRVRWSAADCSVCDSLAVSLQSEHTAVGMTAPPLRQSTCDESRLVLSDASEQAIVSFA